jgi:hypothetical protein
MMRVIQVLRVLSIALLILPLIATAAGAIYVEGQAPPDDGQMHILAAEDGLSTNDAVPLDSAPADGSDIIPISAMEPSGYTVPPMASSAMPFTDLQAQLIIPSLSITNNPGVSTELVVGHIEPPMIPGYWDNVDMDSLKTNMPMLTISGFDNPVLV